MAFLKENLKKILIAKQHRIYDQKLKSMEMTYSKWIAIQEEKLDIDRSISLNDINKLTNDLITEDFGSVENQNEGIKSNSEKKWFLTEINDPNSQTNEKMVFLFISADLFAKNPLCILKKTKSDVILFSIYEGILSKIALPLIYKQFQKKDIVMIYGDEDEQENENGQRENPWFKPDWSPDRFLSGFYFGGLAAVRTKALRKVCEDCLKNETVEMPLERLYLLFFEMLRREGCFELRKAPGRESVVHIPQVLYHSRKGARERIRDLRLPEEVREEKNFQYRKGSTPVDLSVIIPSRDHPEVLFRCLDSLLERTCSERIFEIILVDNGSLEENRKKISEKIRELERKREAHDERSSAGTLAGCRYVYEPMPFNFSKMCNLGAEEARGEVLLFLNDDMEILQSDWMERMFSKALLPRAGAVGAKLLYPDSDIIQHAGITNLRVGPAHKLQFLSDSKVHYFGMNRGVHNMLAVTGACLMVRKEVFRRAGGFDEQLAVAFNDVDLCYKIYEKGCYNIVRNDVVFYHHESLSRGKDGESEEKQQRLLREKDLLYERHQKLYGKDPFYHPYLTTDMLESEYSPAYHYQVTLDMPWAEAARCDRAEKAREDQCLVIGMECAMDIYKWRHGVSRKVMERISSQERDGLPGSQERERQAASAGEEEREGYYFQGYSFVIGSDNACYKKHLLLKNRENGQIWQIPVEQRYRPDIKNSLRDQINVDLTGFAAKLPREAVPPGTYQFGMLAEDTCSRLKLVNWSSWTLET